MVSDAVPYLMGPHVGGSYVTDVRGFTGRGDSFPEHKRHIAEVLMTVVKYLAGQIFFLRCKSRAVNTFAPQERYELKRLMLGIR